MGDFIAKRDLFHATFGWIRIEKGKQLRQEYKGNKINTKQQELSRTRYTLLKGYEKRPYTIPYRDKNKFINICILM